MPQKKVNMRGLRQAVRTRLNSFIRQVVGPEFLTKKERSELPKWDEAVPSFVERVFFMGRVQAILKDREYKTISLERIDQIIATYPLSDVERKVFEDVKAHVGANIKEFTAKVERDVIHAVSAEDAEQLMDAVSRDVLRHEIAEGLLGAQHYAEVAVKLAAKLPEVYGKDWTLIARTEMHGAKQRGHAAAILAGAGPYAALGGPDSRVSIVTEPTRCKDCQRLYENGDGSFKIFKLSELLGNGTNATRRHSKVKGIHVHWVPVVPPAHPRCFCKVKFVPPGYDWVGRTLVKVSDDLQKSMDASAAPAAPDQQGPAVPVWYLSVGQHPVRPVNAVHQTKSGKSWAIPIGSAAQMPDGTEIEQSSGSDYEEGQTPSSEEQSQAPVSAPDPADPFAAPDDPFGDPGSVAAGEETPEADPNDPFAAQPDPFAAADDLFGTPDSPVVDDDQTPVVDPDDPFAVGGDDPFGAPSSPVEEDDDKTPAIDPNDPFATGGGSDPFGAAGTTDDDKTPAVDPNDPFASGPSSVDPFGATVESKAPVTDPNDPFANADDATVRNPEAGGAAPAPPPDPFAPLPGHNSKWSKEGGYPMGISPKQAEDIYNLQPKQVIMSLKPLAYKDMAPAQTQVILDRYSKTIVTTPQETEKWAKEASYGEKAMDFMYGALDGPVEVLGDGSNATDSFVGRIQGNGDAVIKPSTSTRYVGAPYSQPHAGAAHREAAAHRLSEFLEMDGLVPLTIAREASIQRNNMQAPQQELTSWQNFAHDSQTIRDWCRQKDPSAFSYFETYVKHGSVGTPEDRADAMKDLVVFQLVAGCVDAHTKNSMVGPDGKLIAIDNSCSFGSGFIDSKVILFNDMYRANIDLTLSDNMKSKLEKMDYNQFKAFFEGSEMEDWAVANAFLRAKYLLHLNEKEGSIDFNKFRVVSWNQPQRYSWGKFHENGKEEFAARQKLGADPQGLFASFAKKWILDNMTSVDSPYYETAKELHGADVLMPSTYSKSSPGPGGLNSGGDYDMADTTINERRDYWDSIKAVDPAEVLPKGQESIVGDYMLANSTDPDWRVKLADRMKDVK